jgi:hypothetical protein
MRLLRQKRDGHWEDIFSQMEEELQIRIASLRSQ